MFNLKTLERMGNARYAGQVRGLLTRVRDIQSDCNTEPTADCTRWYGLVNLPQYGYVPHYDQAALMAAYLFDQYGGWPRTIQYFSVGDPPSADARFSTVYGTNLDAFAVEFSASVRR